MGKVSLLEGEAESLECEVVRTKQALLDLAPGTGPPALLPKSQPAAFPPQGRPNPPLLSILPEVTQQISVSTRNRSRSPAVSPTHLYYIIGRNGGISSKIPFLLQNSTHIVAFPLTPLEIKDERCTFEHTMHLLTKLQQKVDT